MTIERALASAWAFNANAAPSQSSAQDEPAADAEEEEGDQGDESVDDTSVESDTILSKGKGPVVWPPPCDGTCVEMLSVLYIHAGD